MYLFHFLVDCMDMNYKVAIVDDHKIFREGFKVALDEIKGVNVVGEASNGQEFINFLKNNQVDLVFMDINMPVVDGISAAEESLKINPAIKIIAITASDDIEFVNKMLLAGVEGYLLKDTDYEDIVEAIDKVMNGKSFFSSKILMKLTRSTLESRDKMQAVQNLPSFTKRESEILRLISKGMSNAEIAKALFISERTIEKHKQNLLLKTDTRNTVNLVIYALKNGLADMND